MTVKLFRKDVEKFGGIILLTSFMAEEDGLKGFGSTAEEAIADLRRKQVESAPKTTLPPKL